MKKLLLLISLFGCLCAVSCKDSENTENHQGSEDSLTSEEIEYDASSEEIEAELKEKQNGFFDAAALKELYKNREYDSFWEDADTRNSLISELEKADEEGLSFDYYHKGKIQEILETGELTEKDASQLDLLLSDAFLSYAHDLFYGRLDPLKLHEDWGITREKRDFKHLLSEAAEKNEVEELLAELKPKSQVYTGLKKSLSEFNSIKKKEDAFEKIPSGDLVKPGEEDTRIPQIAARLQDLGFLDSTQTKSGILYSEDIKNGVKKFQEKQGLETDGVIGNTTISELNMSDLDRTNQILANLERWRWYPRDLGNHYILVNIADFRLAVVKDGDTVREHKVVAGSRARKTPIFSDTIKYIVINPKWHVPPTIKNEDVIPKARKDQGYLRSHNLQVVSKSGKIVNPSSINWDSKEPEDYNYVQVAGPSNPLGRVKIIYPNKYLIYLHDTPAKSLFSRNDRAESSGCVRVEHAIDLAAYVVQDQPDWTLEKIQQTIDKGPTTQVKINQPIQVHHFYWTAWRAGEKTIFTNDIYELDEKIYSQLKKS